MGMATDGTSSTTNRRTGTESASPRVAARRAAPVLRISRSGGRAAQGWDRHAVALAQNGAVMLHVSAEDEEQRPRAHRRAVRDTAPYPGICHYSIHDLQRGGPRALEVVHER